MYTSACVSTYVYIHVHMYAKSIAKIHFSRDDTLVLLNSFNVL